MVSFIIVNAGNELDRWVCPDQPNPEPFITKPQEAEADTKKRQMADEVVVFFFPLHPPCYNHRKLKFNSLKILFSCYLKILGFNRLVRDHLGIH